jgi:hypothetical protein
LDHIEATSDKLLGAYIRAEDDAMTLAFGGRGKKRLNRVFDVIGFVYLDYCYPSQKQGKKKKAAASALSATPKGKKVKVLTHRPRYIEMTKVPKLAEGPSSAVEPEYPAPAEAKGESAEVPKRPAEAKENDRRTRIKEAGRATKNPKPATRARVIEGVQNSCNNSKEEKNGQRTRRFHGISKGTGSCFNA